MLSHLTGVVDATVCNDGSTGKVNDNCGADYVKTNQKAPPGIEARAPCLNARGGTHGRPSALLVILSSAWPTADSNKGANAMAAQLLLFRSPQAGDGVQCASLDGDADRLMFFYNNSGKFQMLDGDRIAILCAVFFNELVAAAGLKMNLGIVQTAYANGGSTKCLEKLGASVYILRAPVCRPVHRSCSGVRPPCARSLALPAACPCTPGSTPVHTALSLNHSHSHVAFPPRHPRRVRQDGREAPAPPRAQL